MNGKRLWSIAGVFAALTLAVSLGVLAQAPTPEQLSGLISDYTPLNPNSTPTGPYEMRGQWSLNLKRESRRADFSAFMDMELSDYWVWHSNSDPTNPAIRGAHTHHITMTDATITYGPSNCPADSPATTTRFMITGTPTIITGNGNPAPFEVNGPSTLQVCITGGSDVEFSNMTMVLTGPATGHFGSQAIHGVVRFPHKDDSHKNDSRKDDADRH
jgi:hypothetical protein